MGVITQLITQLTASDLTVTVFSLLGLSLLLFSWTGRQKRLPNEPPMVKYSIPFVGNAIEYGIDPLKFLQECYKKHGDCFTFLMMGRKMTFCLGPDGNHFVFNVPIAHASAEGAYEKLTVPVFGKGVVYDVENSIFMQQKKFVKDSFTVGAFEKYVPTIIEESRSFFSTFPNVGKTVIFEDLSELTIRTASACLMGKEIRSQLHSGVAKLYSDLDSGLAPINVFFRWLPLPTYFARDRAHNQMSSIFKGILKKRREASDTNNCDLLQTLMESTYKDGTKLSDDAVAHLMIATLMGGQHTSSTTSTWMLFEMARRPDVIEKVIREISTVLTGKPDADPLDLLDFSYQQLKKMHYLDSVMKETLRLHPPIHTVMRRVEKNVNYKGHEIAAGHFLCGSAAFSQVTDPKFPDPLKFEPSRFMNASYETGEWSINTVDIAQKSARSCFLPFGAGRHRCIGEAFAYVQIKTIVAHFVCTFKHEMVDQKFPKMDYTSLIVVPEKESFMSFEKRERL